MLYLVSYLLLNVWFPFYVIRKLTKIIKSFQNKLYYNVSVACLTPLGGAVPLIPERKGPSEERWKYTKDVVFFRTLVIYD